MVSMLLAKHWPLTSYSVSLQRAMHEDVTYTKRGVPRTGRATSDQMHIAVRDSNIEIVSMVLEALEGEHDFLCAPWPPCVCEPAGACSEKCVWCMCSTSEIRARGGGFSCRSASSVCGGERGVIAEY